MSATLWTDRGPREFHIVTCDDHYGGLVLPDGSVATREESLALARWIEHGGLFGIEEERARGRSSQRYGPKLANHPSVGKPCPACRSKFVAGDYTALAVIGAARDGNAPAVEVHWSCFTGESEAAKERNK